jgi:hypothetical protein
MTPLASDGLIKQIFQKSLRTTDFLRIYFLKSVADEHRPVVGGVNDTAEQGYPLFLRLLLPDVFSSCKHAGMTGNMRKNLLGLYYENTWVNA